MGETTGRLAKQLYYQSATRVSGMRSPFFMMPLSVQCLITASSDLYCRPENSKTEAWSNAQFGHGIGFQASVSTQDPRGNQVEHTIATRVEVVHAAESARVLSARWCRAAKAHEYFGPKGKANAKSCRTPLM